MEEFRKRLHDDIDLFVDELNLENLPSNNQHYGSLSDDITNKFNKYRFLLTLKVKEYGTE